MAEMPIGQLIRLYRINRKMTMARVATHAGISARYLEMIESGTKIPSVPTLRRIAGVLGVRTSALVGDEPSEDQAGPVTSRLTSVERALYSYGSLLDANAEPPDLADLAARVEAARKAWFLSPNKFSDVLAVLPGLIVDVEYAVRAYDRSREACRLAAEVHQLAEMLCKQAGRPDLCGMLADRAMRYAEETDDPVMIAVASWWVSHALMVGDMPEGALEVVTRAAERLRPLLPDGTPEIFSVYGGLLLCAALAYVRAGEPWHGRKLVRGPAREVAKRVGDGRNYHGMVFGPANVAIHAVTFETETGQVSDAIRLADEVNLDAVASLSGVPLISTSWPAATSSVATMPRCWCTCRWRTGSVRRTSSTSMSLSVCWLPWYGGRVRRSPRRCATSRPRSA